MPALQLVWEDIEMGAECISEGIGGVVFEANEGKTNKILLVDVTRCWCKLLPPPFW